MKLKSKLMIAALVALAGLTPAHPAVAAPTVGSVAITMDEVVVDTSVAGQATISVDVTNKTPGKQIEVDINVIVLGSCVGDVFAADAYDCTREAVGGVEEVSVDPDVTTTLTVVLPLPAGDYLFRARVTGSAKRFTDDQKFGFKPATVLP